MKRQWAKRAVSILCCLVILSGSSAPAIAQVIGSQPARAVSLGGTAFAHSAAGAPELVNSASLIRNQISVSVQGRAAAPSPTAVRGYSALKPTAPHAFVGAQSLSRALSSGGDAAQGGAKTVTASNAAFDAAVSDGGDVAPDASAGLPSTQPQGILEKLGLRGAILKGGGIEFDAEGRIKPVAESIHMQAYDNDDNIAYYRTKIYIRHKTTQVEAGITTSKFAEVRDSIGKSGEYKDYEYFQSPDGGSYRDFRDISDPDVFAKDAADSIESTHSAMFRGPAWLAFAQAMKNPKRAPWAAVVTSRGHKPDNMVRGYDVFKDRGYLARSPRKELIFGDRKSVV